MTHSPIHVHRLSGCAPTPLASYLKALGVLRLVGEQADAGARGSWRSGAFCLVTTLDRDALLSFFLERYAPTPVLSPWNGGSGFYPKDKRDAIDAIAPSSAPRLAAYRVTIAQARALVGGTEARPSDEAKTRFIRRCRASWRPGALAWIDAAVAITREHQNEYPALLGTGGNDGRLDFSNNFMQRLLDVMDAETGAPTDPSAPLLDSALFGSPIDGLNRGAAVGQFSPGGAGGANATAGFEGESLVNPWNFILMLEGAVVLEVSVVRRIDGSGLPRAAAPFAVEPQAGGYASAAPSDEASRGEQWVPLWDRPATLGEIQSLFAEGRLQTGTAGARRAVDAARAVARLGVARGVSAFERYGYIERLGQSNLAVPLGRWAVRPRPQARLLDEIAPWVDELRYQASGRGRVKNPPASFGRALRRLESIMLALCRNAEPRTHWEALLVLLAQTEDELARRSASTASARLRPVPRLSAGWLEVLARDMETRLALAIASQSASGDRKRARDQRLGSIRRNCLPLTPFEDAFAIANKRLVHDPAVVWTARDTVSDLVAVVTRRLIDGRRAGAEGIPLVGRVSARLEDVGRFVAGEADERRLGALTRALMSLSWSDGELVAAARAIARSVPEERSPEPPSPDLALFRLVTLPEPVREIIERTSLDTTTVRLLAAGRHAEAARMARRRLVALGLRPRVEHLHGDASRARRLAASIAIPIDEAAVRGLHRAVCKPETDRLEAPISE